MANVAQRQPRPARGALAMLDALGFKGLWRRPGLTHARILERLNEIRVGADAEITRLLSGGALSSGLVNRKALPPAYYAERISLAFLSDTVVIGVEARLDHFQQLQDPATAADGAAVALAGTFTSAVLREALDKDPRLALRGCIAVGEFSVDDDERFIVGPAVDEAATLQNDAEAAVAWLTPSARRARQVWTPATQEVSVWHRFVPWWVPLKGGRTYDTYAVTPYWFAESRAAKDDLAARLLATFDDSRVDVAIKKQNTARFLDEARKRP